MIFLRFIIFFLVIFTITNCVEKHPLNNPIGYVKDNQNNFYIADKTNNQIIKFDQNLNIIDTFHINMDSKKFYFTLSDLNISPQNELIIKSYFYTHKDKKYSGHRYSLFDTNGQTMSTICDIYKEKDSNEADSLFFIDAKGHRYLVSNKKNSYAILKLPREKVILKDKKISGEVTGYGPKNEKDASWSGVYVSDSRFYLADSSKDEILIIDKIDKKPIDKPKNKVPPKKKPKIKKKGFKKFQEIKSKNKALLGIRGIFSDDGYIVVENIGKRSFSYFTPTGKFVKQLSPLDYNYSKKDFKAQRYYKLKDGTLFGVDLPNKNIYFLNLKSKTFTESHVLYKKSYIKLIYVASIVILLALIIFNFKRIRIFLKNLKFKFFLKLFVVFFPLIIIITFVMTGIIYDVLIENLEKEMEKRVVNLSYAIKNSLKLSDLKAIKSKKDQGGKVYKKIFDIVNKIMDPGSNVKNMGQPYGWIIHKIKDKRFYFGINEWQGPIFEPYIIPSDRRIFFEVLNIQSKLKTKTSLHVYGQFKDEFGTWLSLLNPIIDEKKNIIYVIEIYRNVIGFQKIKEEIRESVLKLFIIIILVLIPLVMLISLIFTRPIKELLKGTHEVKKGNFEYKIDIQTRDEMKDLGAAFNGMTEGLKERDAVKKIFGKYVHKEVAKKVLDGEVQLGGREVTGSILSSDIRKFTNLSEMLSPKDLIEVLNHYFTEMVSHISAQNGVLDKYIGDAILAHFGVLGNPINHEDRAVKTAIDMIRSLERFSHKILTETNTRLEIGIGIHTGNVISGNIGSVDVLEYTIIGDTVNLAFRIEALTKLFKCPIIISETTYNNLTETDSYLIRPLDYVVVKGKSKPIQLYEVFNADEEILKMNKANSLDLLKEAIHLYRDRQFAESVKVLEEIKKFPGTDPLVNYYLIQCGFFVDSPPPEDWDGSVFV